jgi:hypothetical protein
MSSNRAARIAIVLGVLALVAIPVGETISKQLKGVGLLEASEFAVPVAFVLGLCAVAAARRARFSLARSVRRTDEKAVRIARFLAWAGLYVACIGGISLGFYGLLVLQSG